MSFDALTGTGVYAGQPGGVAAAPSAFVEAIVATTPAALDEEVMVLVGAEGSQLQAGPCRWAPRPIPGGLLFPVRGDACLVVTGDKGHRAIVWWKPAVAPTAVGWVAGDMKITAKAAADDGWLLCNGASYLRAAQPALFAALGGASSPWGLPDGTHFQVPDLSGRAPIGAGTATGAAGATAHVLGSKGGEETHLLTGAESGVQAHTHDPAASSFYLGSNNTLTTPAGGSVQFALSAIGATTGGVTGGAKNATTPHTNMAPFATANYVIKT